MPELIPSASELSKSMVWACPVHKTALSHDYFCAACDHDYARINGIPVLINDANSIFRRVDFERPEQAYGGASNYGGHLDKQGGLRQKYRQWVRRLTEAEPPARDFQAADAIRQVLSDCPQARILVIGAGDTSFAGQVVYTDVAFGQHVDCIADAHDLPFLDQSFDACIACAVLEHVVDPQRCVAEIERVLVKGGWVFAETPFMQPVHMGAYDFTRFTRLGHRRLFRRFTEIRSGMAGGPGVSSAQILRYAMVSITDRPALRPWLKLLGLVGSFPLRWLDFMTRRNDAAFDSASGFYFFGRLSDQPLSDRELIAQYRGG